ncbi:MAG: NusG domain II-containing protein [Sedimentibacter sp.]|uniref:NusG domain II-containing protein n=1 Tax=Sedimentibacter sp. TaxID=1960295 RepID=UPI0029815238|nr:NusG domain II-containing protein [Sedimentibacter sp.]MDW5300206.1 NusG domain II-containing protein [Sedimentibacter sp.]
MNKKINKFDIALIVGIVVVNIAMIFFGGSNVVHANEKKAYIYSKNKLVGEYVLTDDYKTEFTIGDKDADFNTIHIENGEIWIQDASCPDKNCVNQGKISNDGEIIVCLPNQLLIKIEQENVENELDFIAK